MKRKVLHLENKTTGEHKYYGSLVAAELMSNGEVVFSPI